MLGQFSFRVMLLSHRLAAQSTGKTRTHTLMKRKGHDACALRPVSRRANMSLWVIHCHKYSDLDSTIQAAASFPPHWKAG
ncbi:hypothetical protein E2C01_088070 [Portunus trituberculatus]|uniref:Uncharacterized protein n=1 Tax=Portunus trituberculatus TaxID=210409 RepID=A0A5B7JED8_PORTR|nr:hypothetical protein [Portunus trituberculatus]